MPAKFPILKKNHILIIVIVILLAGLIGASPAIYQRFSAQPEITTSNDDNQTQDADHQAGDTFSYVFPFISRNPIYFFPMVVRGQVALVQEGAPVYISNFNHPDAGCNWAGVAGQLFGADGSPINGYTVVITGRVNGTTVSLSGVTGGAQAYGIGGYEVQLSNAPFASSGTLTINVFNADLKQVSIPVSLTTYQDCQANLVILNFRMIQ